MIHIFKTANGSKTEPARHQQKIISGQEELFKNREILEYLYAQAPIAIFSYDMDLKITECNEAFLELFHLKKEEVIGFNLDLLPDQSPIKIITNALKGNVQTYKGPYVFSHGSEYWVEVKSFPIHDRENHIIGGVALLENKTNEHKALERLKFLASHDCLTQLANRHGFEEYIESLRQDDKHATHYSLLFYLDLDRFKYVNDSLGHTFGDALLKKVASRLQGLIDHTSNLTRLGGDEFVIVLPFVSESMHDAEKKADLFAKKMYATFEEPFMLDGVRIYMKSSIGIVLIAPNTSDIDEIVRHADISMYQAKRERIEHISFYNHTLDEKRKEMFTLQQDLIYALENGDLEIYLQPIMHIHDNSVHAAEALIRWKHPKYDIMIEPDHFVPMAIELGVISTIGWWLLDKVCQSIHSWKEEERWYLDYISVNINAKQLIMTDFIEHFFKIIQQYDVQTEDIKIEISETSLIDNYALIEQVLHQLQSKGITCAIDNFGTGYSSLSYLKKLSFSVLKIDKEFISDLETNEEKRVFMRTIITIAKQFNYHIVVEGVEKEEQRNIIKDIDENISYQGFLVSKALPIKAFAQKFIK